ncbi:MAG TPA: SUMF1/EgtB/PvdO family nonheme iron enzyme [Gemmatimonadales bacterium]|nr:SUMF1/EgtB/PvdO family nonheme iron enzyme [Gemmatimonadales bacterium]
MPTTPELLDRLQGALADRYRFDRELGRGGMATVFLARDLKHDRPVALKVLHPELSAVLGHDRFLREVRISAHLQHPHILTLIDSGEVPGAAGAPDLLWYVMPYVDGESLRDRLAREGALGSAAAAGILADVLEALAEAHRQGIVHRDIKPDNIMLAGRHALVVDFGVARAAAGAGGTAAGATMTAAGLAIGTPAYMAPEQALGQEGVDGRADLYAAGVVGYEMLTGAPPFTGTTPQAVVAAQISRSPASLDAVRPPVPAGLAEVVMRALAKDPADRWASAEAMLEALEGTSRDKAAATGVPPVPPTARRRLAMWAGLAVAAVAIGSAIWAGPVRHAQRRAWVREEAIPRILALVDSGKYEGAYALARQVEAVLPGDSMFDALRPKFALRYPIRTSPPGAEVWRSSYEATDSTWIPLGRTPIDSALMAFSSGGGQFDGNRVRLQAPGYRTMELAGLRDIDRAIPLDRDDAIPREMVRVLGGQVAVAELGFEREPPITLGDFLIDRFEVTNRDFQRFVDSGGYRRRELWPAPMVRNGREIGWEAAVALMTDRTGRTGPAGWEAGEFPAGEEHQPVGGVSWYEAMAYARFVGKSLPTVAHWNRAASLRNSAWMVPPSNFSGRGSVPVGQPRGVSAFGASDMAGNVREWCLNASGTERFILGGGWRDPPYRFNDTYTQDPFDRNVENGIRLARYPANEPNLARASAPLIRQLRDFSQARPVSDAVFAAYRQMYEYDRLPLAPRRLELIDEGEWTRELVQVTAGYAADSLLLYLYLPKRGSRPYPAVVYYPPGGAIPNLTISKRETAHFDFLLKSGRAVLYPVFKGTYQRKDGLQSDAQDSTIFYRDHVVMWAKDLRRGVDYLATRPEVSIARLGYYGVSWGGALGGLMPAVEPRIKVIVLEVAGLDFPPVRPEVDPVNFLPRIHAPTLMINGRYDFYFPVETSQRPMFRLLGTPAADKRHVVEDGSHFVPRARLIQESLAWLDKYQGTGDGAAPR